VIAYFRRPLGVYGYSVGFLVALALAVPVLAIMGADPFEALDSLVVGATGEPRAIGNTLTMAAPIALAGLAVAVPLRAGLLNIGGEGQLLAGALAAVVVGLTLPAVSIATAAAAILAGALAGAAWAAIPALGRGFLGANEVVSTLMLNFVAIQLLSYLVNHPLREERGIFPQTDRLPPEVLLTPGLGEFRLHAGIALAAVLAILVSIGMARLRVAYRLRIVGADPSVAGYLGVSRRRYMIGGMLLGGSLAGVGGAIQLLGVQGRVIEGFSPGFGFDGVVAAFLAGGNPAGTAIAAIALGALRAGGTNMQHETQLPESAVIALEAILIIATLLGRHLVQRRVAAAGTDGGLEDAARLRPEAA
jgi:simple sugar transport system permease protein